MRHPCGWPSIEFEYSLFQPAKVANMMLHQASDCVWEMEVREEGLWPCYRTAGSTWCEEGVENGKPARECPRL